jgi:hypothetical protein
MKKISYLLLTVCLLNTSAYALTKTIATNVVFVQNAKSAELSKEVGQPGSYHLTLHKPDAFVSYFSDRPQRVTGLLASQKFLNLWDLSSKAHFKQNPPNAALESKNANLIGTLTKPEYNQKTGDISYRFTPLNTAKVVATHKNLGYTVLFVDDISWDPGGFGDSGN